MSKASAPQQVLELVERFDRNRDAYRSPQYTLQLRVSAFSFSVTFAGENLSWFRLAQDLTTLFTEQTYLNSPDKLGR